VVTVSVPADRVQALSDGNGNFASNTLSRTYSGAPDVTAPTVSSIARAGATPTNADALSFTVTFSESVTGVDAGDFVLTRTGTAGGAIGAVSGSGTTYTVNVTGITGDGTLRLDVVANPTISDLSSNVLVGPYTSGQLYDIDNTPPAAPVIAGVTTDTGVPGDGVTSDTTLVVLGSSDPGVTVQVYRGGTTLMGAASANGTGAWSCDSTGTPLAAGGYSLTARATDAAGNVSSASSPFLLVVDPVAPAVSSIVRASATPTRAASVVFNVALSEPVGGLDAADFILTRSGTAGGSIAAMSGSGASYTVTVDGVAGEGSLRLDVVASPSASDLAGNPLAGPFTGGAAYDVDTVAPAAPSGLYALADSGRVAGSQTNDNTLSICGGAEADASVGVFVDTVLVGTTTALPNGTWCLDYTSHAFPDGAYSFTATATDGVGNVSTVSTALLLTVETSPFVAGIARLDANPTNADSLSFTVTFNEMVTGVDAADFEVAATGTATGSIGTVSGSWSSYTVSVVGVSGDGALRLDVVANPSISDLDSHDVTGPYTVGEIYDVDNTPPDAPSVSSAASSTTDKTPTWTWTPGANAGSGNYRRQLDAQDAGGWFETTDTTFTPAADLGVGVHTLYVAERDAAGNWSATGSYAVTVTTATTDGGQEPPAGSGCGCNGAGAGGGAGMWLLAGLLVRRRTRPQGQGRARR
jgi:hypothetical protein